MTTNVKRRAQRGLSMIGFLFVAAVVLVVALLAFRMIPSYIEYYTVQKALEGALADSNDLSHRDHPPRRGAPARGRLRGRRLRQGRRGHAGRQQDHRVRQLGEAAASSSPT